MKPLNTNPVDGQNVANLNDKGCGLCNGTGIADLPDPWGGVRGTCPDCLGGGYDGVTTHPEFGAAPGVMVDAPAEREPWVPYLSDRADGVRGHYAICRWNAAGYREAWNLRSHRWASFSEEVLTLEEAQKLLAGLTLPSGVTVLPGGQGDA